MRARLYSYYGGKNRMTKEIQASMAVIENCSLYIEPFFGSGAVFFSLEKERYKRAIINDLDESVIHFVRMLAGKNGVELIERLKHLESNRYAFYEAKEKERMGYIGCSDMERAVSFYILQSQSFNCLRKDYREGMDIQAYQRQIEEGLPKAREKLQGVEIVHGDAYDMIERYKHNPSAVFFIDSPYVHKTRSAKKCYYHEMSDADHVRMLLAVKDAKAKFILCGYKDEYDDLYDHYLMSNPNWNTQLLKEVTKPSANQFGKQGKKAQEWIWKNF